MSSDDSPPGRDDRFARWTGGSVVRYVARDVAWPLTIAAPRIRDGQEGGGGGEWTCFAFRFE